MDLVTLLCATLAGSVSPSEAPASRSRDFGERGCSQHPPASPSPPTAAPRDQGLLPRTGTWLMSPNQPVWRAVVVHAMFQGWGGRCLDVLFWGFFPISFIWNHCCKLSGPVPWEGRREARFGARFQPTGFLPFSPLITARAMHACARHFSHLLASLTILPANKGWTQFPVEPVNVAAELPGDSQREAFLPSLLLSVLGPSSWARFSQVKPYWLHWLHWIYLGLHQCIREQDLA